MHSLPTQSVPDVSEEISRTSTFPAWMERLWPLYCVLVACVTFGYALWDPYQIDGDAVAYMDIGDLLRAHQWAGVVNAYWHPLYPAMLSIGHGLFHATRSTELHAYYMVNFGIFLLEMLAIVCFTDSLVWLRDALASSDTLISARQKAPGFLCERFMLRYLGLALLVIASQRELSLGKVRPDALLQALLLFGMAALLRYLATGKVRYAGLMGLVLGCAYLTKSFAFLFTLICILLLIGFRWLWQRQPMARTLAAGLLAGVCFGAVAGPYIAALSKQKGHFDFGDSGALNYAWYVGGTEKFHLQNGQKSLYGTSDVHLKHPNQVLLSQPLVVSYKQLPYGTYPDWFDATYWNDQIKTHMNWKGEERAVARDLVLAVRYLFNHPESWLLLLLLLAQGARLSLGWRPRSESADAFWVVPSLMGLAVFSIYGLVNIEERYVNVGFLAILLPLFAALRQTPASETTRNTPAASPQPGSALAASLVLLLALLAVGESLRVTTELRRHLPASHRQGWYQANIFGAAKALHAMGVEPGDTIACIGTTACLYDPYWARLAGVRVLTEVYFPDTLLDPYFAAMAHRDQVYDVVRRQGAKVLVGDFEPGLMTAQSSLTAGWRELDDTPYYVYPLNLDRSGPVLVAPGSPTAAQQP